MQSRTLGMVVVFAIGVLTVVGFATGVRAQAEMMEVAAMNVPSSSLLLQANDRAVGQADPDAIGSVKVVTAPAYIIRDGEEMTAAEGMLLYRADTLRTGDQGALGALMRDSTAVSLGAESELAVESFAFDPAKGKLSFVARLSEGVMACVSGTIAKLQPDAVQFHTPHAVIGVSGTHFAVKVED